MDSSSGGFFFSFGPTSEADSHSGTVTVDAVTSTGSAPGTVGASPPVWPPAKTSTAIFPWIPLDTDTLKEWAARYCSAVPDNDANEGILRRKPLQLRLRAASALSAGTASSENPWPLDARSGSDLTLCYQTPPEVETLTSFLGMQTTERLASKEYRDVIPGRYYGGLKVWSCAVLLAEYLVDNAEQYRRLFESAAVVAELGCGQGLPGMTAMCLGARRVMFQDYNAEVLHLCTKPNVAATVSANNIPHQLHGDEKTNLPLQTKFVHGDWVDLSWESQGTASSLTDPEASYCDVILGADVTFDKEACDKLSCILHRWLRPRTGTAIVVTKDYYFGTSGGCLQLAISAKPYGLRVDTLKRVDTADKMPHVVLQITHIP